MSPRERILAISLSGVLLFVVVGLGGYWFWNSYRTNRQQLEKLEVEIDDLDKKIKHVNNSRPLLDRWRKLSLVPGNIAREDYKRYLTELLAKHQVKVDSSTMTQDSKSTIVHPTKPGKVPIYTGLNFNIRGKAELKNFVAFMHEFQRTAKMHRIKTMTLERAEGTGGKKDPNQVITISMVIEAIIILDAEAVQKRQVLPDRKTMALEIALFMKRWPGGLPLAAWASGPLGPITPPINPPQDSKSRTYETVGAKNPFVGKPLERETPTKEKVPFDYTPDDIKNMMKHNRWIGVVNDIDDFEAKFWDSSMNSAIRITTASAYSKIPLIQAGSNPKTQVVLAHAVVSKIDFREMIVRVTLNSSAPASTSKWWRYPDEDGHYYRLHQEDFASLLEAKKVKTEDKGRLYVVKGSYWFKEVMPKLQKIISDKDKDKGKGKGFGGFPSMDTKYLFPDKSTVQVVVFEKDVVVVRCDPWPPTPPEDSSLGVSRLYPSGRTIYKPHKYHLQALIDAKKVKAEEAERVYVLKTSFFDDLVTDKLIEADGSKFTFWKKLLRGDIVSRANGVVVLRLAEKYCYYPGIRGDKDGGIKEVKERWHEGFLVLHIAGSLDDALMYPLAEYDVKQLLTPTEALDVTFKRAMPLFAEGMSDVLELVNDHIKAGTGSVSQALVRTLAAAKTREERHSLPSIHLLRAGLLGASESIWTTVELVPESMRESAASLGSGFRETFDWWSKLRMRRISAMPAME